VITIIDDAYPIFEHVEKIVSNHNNLKPDNDTYNHLGNKTTGREMQEIHNGKLQLWFQKKAQEFLIGFAEEHGFSTEQRFALCDSLFHFHYNTGDELPRHFDDPAAMFSMVLYLNDCDSGATYFPIQEVWVKPKKNRLAIFPSSIYGAHEAEPVLEGHKDILGCFVHIVMDQNMIKQNYYKLLKERG